MNTNKPIPENLAVVHLTLGNLDLLMYKKIHRRALSSLRLKVVSVNFSKLTHNNLFVSNEFKSIHSHLTKIWAKTIE